MKRLNDSVRKEILEAGLESVVDNAYQTVLHGTKPEYYETTEEWFDSLLSYDTAIECALDCGAKLLDLFGTRDKYEISDKLWNDKKFQSMWKNAVENYPLPLSLSSESSTQKEDETMTNETTQPTAVESTEAATLTNDIQHITTEPAEKKTAKKAPSKKSSTQPKGKKAMETKTTKKSAPAKKSAPKTSKKTPAKKTPAPKKADAKKNGAPKIEGLRAPQVRILLALLKKPQQSRVQLSASAPVDQAACVEYIGSPKDEVRLANDKKHFPSLISLGFVRQEQLDLNGKDVIVYSLTAKGKKEAEKAKAGK